MLLLPVLSSFVYIGCYFLITVGNAHFKTGFFYQHFQLKLQQKTSKGNIWNMLATMDIADVVETTAGGLNKGIVFYGVV